MLPFVYDPGMRTLRGHLARNNDQWRRPVVGEALVIVRGPDAYISPAWYPSKAEHGRVVPTWNYVTAHVYGRLAVHDDPAWVEQNVRDLTGRHEAGRPQTWSVDDAPRTWNARRPGRRRRRGSRGNSACHRATGRRVVRKRRWSARRGMVASRPHWAAAAGDSQLINEALLPAPDRARRLRPTVGEEWHGHPARG